MEFLFKEIDYQKNFLNYLKAKDHAIVSNIANAETPFYKRLKVELLNTSDEIPLKVTSPQHISNKPMDPFAYKIVQDKSSLVGADGNNVSLEKEIVELEKTALKYETVMKFIQGNFGSLDIVIKGLTGG